MRPILLVDDEANLRMLYDDFYDWEAEAFASRPTDLLELRGAWAWSFQPQNRDAAGKKVQPSLGSKQLLCSPSPGVCPLPRSLYERTFCDFQDHG